MKLRKVFFLLLCVIFSTTIISAENSGKAEFADESKGISDAEISYEAFPVYKVFEDTDVFLVLYQKSGAKLSQCIIPKSWGKNDSEKPKKLQQRKLEKGLKPYMIYVKKNGEFYKVILSLPISRLDSVWGILENKNKITESDINKDTLDLN